jgi:primosomal protein N' (replication factor Y)
MERVEQLIPSARLARMDSDIMNHPREYAHVLEQFSARETDVLIGTQMIAKGLDFPHVSLVGVVDADIVGRSADFRSGESQFQLISQVAGRTGRGTLPGRVIVQSTMPHAPSLRFAADHDYASFAEEELRFRAKTNYPPYTRLARIILSDHRRPHLIEQAEQLVVRLIKLTTKINQPESKGHGPTPPEAKIEGPLPCAIHRLKNRYRYDILIRCRTAGALQRFMDHAAADKLLRANVKSIVIDIDPVSLA